MCLQCDSSSLTLLLQKPERIARTIVFFGLLFSNLFISWKLKQHHYSQHMQIIDLAVEKPTDPIISQ